MFGDRVKPGKPCGPSMRVRRGTTRRIGPTVSVFPRSTDEVSQILALCNAHKVPVIPHGAGTSLEGHLSALFGGVSVERISFARSKPGRPGRTSIYIFVIRAFSFPSIQPPMPRGGGWPRRAHREPMRCATEPMYSRSRRCWRTAPRSKADLTGLVMGSEGTLALATEVTLRLHGLPENTAAAVCAFEDLEDAVQTVIALTQMAYGSHVSSCLIARL